MDEIPYQDWKDTIWQDWEMSNRLSGLGDLQYDPYNSNSFRNNYLSQSIRVGYRKVHAKYNLNAGLSLNPSMSRSVNLTNPDKNIPTRNVLNYAPYLRFRYKFSKIPLPKPIISGGRRSLPCRSCSRWSIHRTL